MRDAVTGCKRLCAFGVFAAHGGYFAVGNEGNGGAELAANFGCAKNDETEFVHGFPPECKHRSRGSAGIISESCMGCKKMPVDETACLIYTEKKVCFIRPEQGYTAIDEQKKGAGFDGSHSYEP